MLEDFGLLLPLKVSAGEGGGVEKMGKQRKGNTTSDGKTRTAYIECEKINKKHETIQRFGECQAKENMLTEDSKKGTTCKEGENDTANQQEHKVILKW